MNYKTLHKISYGFYVVSSKKDDKFNGQIANALFQVTSEPPTLAISINKQNLTHEYIDKSKIFTVSILSEKTPMRFIGTFGFKSGQDIDKFKKIKYKIGKTKAPIVLDNALAYIQQAPLPSEPFIADTFHLLEFYSQDWAGDWAETLTWRLLHSWHVTRHNHLQEVAYGESVGEV